jgi:hypothetical protein
VTWASFDDQFTKMPVWDRVPYEARWHYVALVTFCCASHRWDGRLTWRQAGRVSDVPEPTDAVMALIAAGLLLDCGAEIQLLYIDQHIPPEGQRPDILLPRKRRNQAEYRRRQCEVGHHSKDCPASTCPAKQGRVTDRLTGNATGNAGPPALRDRFDAGNAGRGGGGRGRGTSTTKPSLEEESMPARENAMMCSKCGYLPAVEGSALCSECLEGEDSPAGAPSRESCADCGARLGRAERDGGVCTRCQRTRGATAAAALPGRAWQRGRGMVDSLALVRAAGSRRQPNPWPGTAPIDPWQPTRSHGREPDHE